jgi:hypothetical protein
VGGDTAPASNDGKDRGVEFRYYDGSAKIGFFGFDRSSQEFAFLTSASNSSEVLTGTDGALRAGSVHVTGAGTSLDVDANANIDGTLTVDGQITSQVSSGPALVIPTTDKINNLNADLLDSMTTATANTASTVVNRDSSGNFAANIITVAAGTGAGAGIQGNALTADTFKTARTITVDGVVNGNVSFDGSQNVTITTTYDDADITALAAMAGTGYVVRTAANTYAQRTLAVTASSGITLTNADGVAGNTTINVASTSNNSANNLVLRDANGDFAANEITSDLVGNLTGATSTAKDLNPAADSTYDLGTSSVRWQGIFADAANITAITGALTGNVTGQVSDISNHSTTNLTEGSNLYYTDERVDDRVDALIVAGTGITKAYNDAAGTYTLTVTQADIDTDNVTEGSTNLFTTAARTRTHFTYGTGIELSAGGQLSVTQADINTDNITEGSTNIFYTDARFDTRLASKTTDNLTEGSNLYYTDARADARVTAGFAAKSTSDLSEGTNLYYTDARADARIAAADTDDLTEGSTNLYFTNARSDARFDTKIAAATTDNLSEGSTNQYYTEARVQAKLDNAFEQLSAMLNNLATATTLTLNLSGDPTPGAAVTTSVTNGGGGGFTAGTAVATTGGTGSSLTVDTTVVGGVITAAAVNAGGTGYLVNETVTITNANAGKVLSFNLGTLSGGTGYTTATGVAATGGTGSALTVDITASNGVITNVVINDGGTGYAADETVTITNANASGIKTVGNFGATDAARTPGTYTLGTSDYGTEASGANATFTVVIGTGGTVDSVTVTDDGSGFIVNETVTVADAQLGGGGAAALTFDVTAIHGNGATVNTSTVATNATLQLTDVTTMEVGSTVTGATSGTTGVITALGTNAITVDTVDGFFKKGEVVSANDVTTLTISSFA